MIEFASGPTLRDAVVRRHCAADSGGWANYTYVDTSGRRVPEYAADRVQLRVFYRWPQPPGAKVLLSQLAESLLTMAGCLSAELLLDHKYYRPQVVAIFDRQKAAE